MDERQQSGAETGGQHAAEIEILGFRRRTSSGFLSSFALGFGKLCGAAGGKFRLVGSSSAGLIGGGAEARAFSCCEMASHHWQKMVIASGSPNRMLRCGTNRVVSEFPQRRMLLGTMV